MSKTKFNPKFSSILPNAVLPNNNNKATPDTKGGRAIGISIIVLTKCFNLKSNLLNPYDIGIANNIHIAVEIIEV